MNPLQKAAAQAIVNVFETGCVRGDYANVTRLEGDTGRLTYGRSQTTLGSGNLYRLIRDYVNAPDAAYAAGLAPYLPRLETKHAELDDDAQLRELLRVAGADPVMRRVQDRFFDRVYWTPAIRAARRKNLYEPLSVAVVYDSHVHGSWGHVRRLTDRDAGDVAGAGGERNWIARYISVRRAWLASRRNRWLRRTVYRMDAFRQLVEQERWDLALPFEVRGVRITREELRSPRANRIAAGPSAEGESPDAADTGRPHTG